jgi:hypothetical protein
MRMYLDFTLYKGIEREYFFRDIEEYLVGKLDDRDSEYYFAHGGIIGICAEDSFICLMSDDKKSLDRMIEEMSRQIGVNLRGIQKK